MTHSLGMDLCAFCKIASAQWLFEAWNGG